MPFIDEQINKQIDTSDYKKLSEKKFAIFEAQNNLAKTFPYLNQSLKHFLVYIFCETPNSVFQWVSPRARIWCQESLMKVGITKKLFEQSLCKNLRSSKY